MKTERGQLGKKKKQGKRTRKKREIRRKYERQRERVEVLPVCVCVYCMRQWHSPAC